MEDFDKARRQRRFRQKNMHNRKNPQATQPRPRMERRKTPRQRLSYEDYLESEDEEDFYEEFGEFFVD